MMAAGAVRYHREFPRQVEGILHAGIHSLAASRTVNVRRVSRQKDPAALVVGDLALVDVEGRQPDRVRNFDAARSTPVQDSLNIFEGGIGTGSIRVCRSTIGNDTITARRDGKNDQHTVGMPEGACLTGMWHACEMCIRQHPVARLRAAFEFHSEFAANGAVRTVAPNQPGSFDDFLTTVSIAEDRTHRVLRIGEPGDFDRSFDLHPKLLQEFLEQALSFALWNHQREGIVSLRAIEVYARYWFGARGNVRGCRFQASGKKTLGAAQSIHEFERAAPDNQGFRFVGALSIFLNDAD